MESSVSHVPCGRISDCCVYMARAQDNILNCLTISYYWASLMAQLVNNLPATRETWVRSLGWEDPLEEGMATHSSILAWRIAWTL